MNTADYFTYVNAMFIFCIFTCGLLVWSVIRGYILKGKLIKEQDSHLKATKINSLLTKENKEIDEKLAQAEHKLRDAEKEIRELQAKLDHAEADRIELRAERATLENKLTDALAKVRKRDKDGKFLPSGNARVRTPKKLKLVTDLGFNECILCTTQADSDSICRLMHDAAIKRASGSSYISDNLWDRYKEKTVYFPNTGEYSGLNFAKREGHAIHPASDFIARPKRVKKVKAASDAEHAFDEMMGNPIEQLQEAFSQIKAESPKLVHGLTVKNPTEDEAKMIFDEARRLGIEVEEPLRATSSFPWIQYFAGKIESCIDLETDSDEYVTAKEFVQRMQNGRG